MSQIFQSLCLNYKPLTPEQREQKKLAREEYLRNEELPLEQRTSRYYKPYEQSSKFLDVGYEFIRAKGIPIEYWDEAETEEFCALMEQKMTKLKDREEERQKRYDELFGKPKCSDQNSASQGRLTQSIPLVDTIPVIAMGFDNEIVQPDTNRGKNSLKDNHFLSSSEARSQ